MTLGEWLALVPAVVAVLSIIYNVVMMVKDKKATAIIRILGKVPEYVKEAESVFGAGQGQAKLNWVLTKLQIECVKLKVKVSDDELVCAIEQTLETPQKK